MFAASKQTSTISDMGSPQLAPVNNGRQSPSLGPRKRENNNIIDLKVLDEHMKSGLGLKETDVSYLNKQQKRRPGGSLSNTASQHLKNTRPMSPLMSNFSTSPRTNSITSVASSGGTQGNMSPFNPSFSPRTSLNNHSPNGGQAQHVFYPPRRGQHLPNSPSGPKFSSIEVIAMEEKIKELHSQLIDKDEQLRKSISSQHSLADDKVMKQYSLLEQENLILGKELNNKNQEIIINLKELQEKNEIIKEMETYSNEQFEKIGLYEDELDKMRKEAQLQQMQLKVKDEEAVKQRHNMKFEYDALIENKIKANQTLSKQMEETERQNEALLLELEERKNRVDEEVEEARSDAALQIEEAKRAANLLVVASKKDADERVEAAKKAAAKSVSEEVALASKSSHEQIELAKKQVSEAMQLDISTLYGFLVEFVRDSNVYIPVNILKDKLLTVNESPIILRVNQAGENRLVEMLDSSVNDALYSSNFNSPDLVNNSDISPSVFSDVPATYIHQNNSYVTSISRSSSIYSKQNTTQENVSSKSYETTPENKKQEKEEDHEPVEIENRPENKYEAMEKHELYKSALAELTRLTNAKESVYQHKIEQLIGHLESANYMISKLSVNNSIKHKTQHENLERRQEHLMLLTNSLLSMIDPDAEDAKIAKQKVAVKSRKFLPLPINVTSE